MHLELENIELRRKLRETEIQAAVLNQKYRAAMRGLESLSPSGSEFHADPEACVAYVRERLTSERALVLSTVKGKKAMRKALEAIDEYWGDHPVPLSPHALLTESDTLEIRTQIREALGLKA